MTKREATEMLDGAISDDIPCSLNGRISQPDAIKIMRNAIAGLPTDDSVVREQIATNIRKISKPTFRL